MSLLGNPLSDSLNAPNFTQPSPSRPSNAKSPAKSPRKGRRSSIGKEGKEMSPRSVARRMAKPRKSILKSFPTTTLGLSPSKSKSPGRKSVSGQGRRGSFSGTSSTDSHLVGGGNTYHGSGIGARQDDGSDSEMELDSSPEKVTYNQRAHTTSFSSAPDLPSSTGAHTISFPEANRARPAMLGVDATSEQRDAEAKRKQERREMLAFEASRRKSVSFASFAHVRMFDKPEATPAGAGPMISAAAAAVATANASKTSTIAPPSPAKSIDAETVQAPAGLFAPPPCANPPSRRASTGGVKRHGRQSSITEMPLPGGPGGGGGATITGIFAPPSMNDQSADAGEDTMEMDIETDDEAEETPAQAFSGSVNRPFAFSAPRASIGGRSNRMSYGGDGDVTMDMDVTQIVSHGIISSTAADTTADDSVEISIDNEEQTMDFTVALGSDLPREAPANARSDRRSIGYTVEGPPGVHGNGLVASPIRSVVSGGVNPFATFGSRGGNVFTLPVMDDSGEDSGAMDMEETMAMGRILSGHIADESHTTDASEDGENAAMSFRNTSRPQDDDDMEFTIAVGGILDGMPTFAMNVTSPTVSSIEASVLQSESTRTTPRKETSAVPSFARPTVASESRLVTSPTKVATPRSQTPTRESARQTLFGTPSKSGGTPRRAEEILRPGNPVAMSPYKPSTPGQSPAKRSNAIGTPSPGKSLPRISPSPAKLGHYHPSPGRMGFFAPPLHEIPASPSWAQEGAHEQISLAAFLEMTGVQFMEGMPTGQRRKSVMPRGRSSMNGRESARLSEGLSDRQYSLSEYASGMLDGLIYNMYLWASHKLDDDIKKTQTILAQQDEDITADNPPVIKEYLASADEDKTLLEAVMHNLKTNAHLTVRSHWYDWRQSTITQLIPNLIKMRDGLKADAENIESQRAVASEILPSLRERFSVLQLELAQEKEAVAEIAKCDQEELKDLKAGIAEQGAQITGYKSELSEATEKLSELEAKLSELTETKRELSAAIAVARKECDQQKGFGKGAAWGLRNEFNALQQVHSWRIAQLHEDRLEMVYDGECKVSMDCEGWKPVASTSRVELVKEDPSALPFLAVVQNDMMKMDKKDAPAVLHRVSKIWSTVQRLRAEFALVNLRWPVSYAAVPHAIKADVTVVIPTSKSKVIVSFIIPVVGASGWPSSLYGSSKEAHRVKVDVRSVYGAVDLEELGVVANALLEGATEVAYSGVFVSVCAEVAASAA